MDIRAGKQNTIRELLNTFTTLQNIYNSRDLLKQLIKRNIQIRYKGSILGLFWLFATPLFMLAVYTFVFSVVFKARWATDGGDSKAAFALTMFCGLSVFNIFSESLTGSVSTISNNPNYVKKVVFPLEILPIASMLSSLFFGLIWIGILVLSTPIFLQQFSITVVCVPLILLPLLLLSCGLSWFLASLAVYFRDIIHAVGILIQILFFMTPIFYSIEMVPESFRKVLRANPLTDIVQNAREILIFGHWPNWKAIAILTAFSLCIFQLGYVWFMKTKKGFADVL